LGSPQTGFVAQPFGASKKTLCESRLLPLCQPRLASCASGLAQGGFAALPLQQRPARHALASHARPASHFRLVQPLPQQPQGCEPALFESIKITPYTFWISHTGLDAGYPKRYRYIMRNSIISHSDVWRANRKLLRRWAGRSPKRRTRTTRFASRIRENETVFLKNGAR